MDTLVSLLQSANSGLPTSDGPRWWWLGSGELQGTVLHVPDCPRLTLPHDACIPSPQGKVLPSNSAAIQALLADHLCLVYSASFK